MLEKKVVSQCISSDYCRGWNDAVDAMPRWISVEERLPERGVEVLGTNGKAVEMCTYWPGQPTPWESWTAFHFKPTHWMPLPEPPEESP